MSASSGWDPCLVPVEHLELPTPGRVRVVEILATGTNGGAPEHLFSLMTRLDPTRYDASVVALSGGSAVRKLERHGVPVTIIDDPDDASAVRALAATFLFPRRSAEADLAARPCMRACRPEAPTRPQAGKGHDPAGAADDGAMPNCRPARPVRPARRRCRA